MKEGERGATTYGKTSITDGDISSNMDIYWDGITQFDPEINSYNNLRFLNKSGVYRQPGELFLDITYDLGSVKNLGELWIATNTENNYYKTGVYEVYISNSLNDLYYTDNFYTSFDSRNQKYSGITKTIFSCGKEGRYLGIRITQGIINRPTTNPWSTSGITSAYARMRGVALFEYNLDDGETYRIVNTTSGFALEVKGAETDSGTRLWQNNLDLEANFQEFTFDYISNGEYKIKPKQADGMILGLNVSSQVVLVEDSNADSSRWYIKSFRGSGYTIVNKAYLDKFLSIEDKTAIGTYPNLSTSTVGSIWAIGNFASDYVKYNSLQLGSSSTLNIAQGGEYWYTFSPTEHINYTFLSHGTTDTYGELYQGNTPIKSDDNSGEGNNFCISYTLIPNIQYKLKVRGCLSTTQGSAGILVVVDEYGDFSCSATDYPINTQRLDDVNESNAQFDIWPASTLSRYYGWDTLLRTEALSDIYEATLATCLGGLVLDQKDAADALYHFLTGNGTIHTISVNDLCSDSQIINNLRKDNINLLLFSSEKIVPVSETRTIYNSSIIHENEISDNENWHNTLGGCEFRVKATVSRTSSDLFTANIEFSVIDFYDWDRTQTSMGKKPVSPSDMWELHHGGIAKNFITTGSSTLSVSWSIGQRWGSGATVTIN